MANNFNGDRTDFPAATQTTYPPATTAQVIEFFLRFEQTKEEREKKVIPYLTDRTKTYRSILKRSLNELDFLMRNDPEAEKKLVKSKFEKMDWSRAGTGRSELTKKSYIENYEKNGIKNNSAGFLQINIAKLMGMKSKASVNRKGDETQAFEITNFNFSWDENTKSVTISANKENK